MGQQQALASSLSVAAESGGSDLAADPPQQQKLSAADTDAAAAATSSQRITTDQSLLRDTAAVSSAQAVAASQSNGKHSMLGPELNADTHPHPHSHTPPQKVIGDTASPRAAVQAGKALVNSTHVIGEELDQRAFTAQPAAASPASSRLPDEAAPATLPDPAFLPGSPKQAALVSAQHPVGEELDSRSIAKHTSSDPHARAAKQRSLSATAKEHVAKPSAHVVGEELHELGSANKSVSTTPQTPAENISPTAGATAEPLLGSPAASPAGSEAGEVEGEDSGEVADCNSFRVSQSWLPLHCSC